MLKFIRIYAVASAAVMLAAIITMVTLYYTNEQQELIAQSERANRILAQSLARLVLAHGVDHVDHDHAEMERLVRAALRDQPILGALFLDRDANRALAVGTVPNDSHIEEDVRSVLAGGRSHSRLLRPAPGAGVLISYIPIQGAEVGVLTGVFVLVSDVSDLVVLLEEATWELVGGAALFFILLYGALTTIVWLASRMVAQNYRDLIKARRQAEEGSRAKSLFLATMSHEIRTPLNGIMAAAELLSADDLGEDQRRLTEIIHSSSEGLRATIEDVLDFSRIEAGRLQLEEVQFSLVRLVEDAAEMLSIRAAEKGLALSLLVEPATPDHLRGDPQRLRQVLVNLVGNAIKFTEAGYVAIRVMAEGEPGIFLLIEVLDTGIGVPPDHRSDIFNAFEQGDNSTQRRFGGTGLGLAISRAIVQGMGGSIGADAGPDGGSRFWFRVPLLYLPDRRNYPEADLTGLRVRVEETCVPRRHALLRYLAYAGAVIVESDAQVALVVDAEAPHPIGAAMVVLPPPSAPVRRSALIRWVAEASGREIPAVAINRRADDPPPAASGRRLLLAEDHVANQTVLRMMIEQMGHSVTIAANGVQAWELLCRTPFDLLVSDCHMPEMDGPSLVRRIRAAEMGTDQHLPVIALTADARSESIEDSMAAGFDLWLAKPVSRREFRRAIDAALARHSMTATTVQSAPMLDAPVLDRRVLLDEVLGGREDLLVALLREFIAATRPDMEALERLWRAGDCEAARKRSHTTKGAARMAGALRLAALCQSFENDIRDKRLDQADLWLERIAEGFRDVERAVDALDIKVGL